MRLIGELFDLHDICVWDCLPYSAMSALLDDVIVSFVRVHSGVT
jgi:hypothetical protein